MAIFLRARGHEGKTLYGKKYQHICLSSFQMCKGLKAIVKIKVHEMHKFSCFGDVHLTFPDRFQMNFKTAQSQ